MVKSQENQLNENKGNSEQNSNDQFNIDTPVREDPPKKKIVPKMLAQYSTETPSAKKKIVPKIIEEYPEQNPGVKI